MPVLLDCLLLEHFDPVACDRDELAGVLKSTSVFPVKAR